MNVNLKSLVGRLNDVSRGALEGAAGLCLSRTNYDVEVEHILAKILEQDDTDLHKIAAHYEINIDRLNKDVQTALERLKTGNSRTPGLSDRIPEWIQNAWLLASVDFGAARVRTGHLILALLASGGMSRIGRDISKEFDHISVEDLQKKLPEITTDSAEARDAVRPVPPTAREPLPRRVPPPVREPDSAAPYAPYAPQIGARCSDILQKASLEPLTAEEAAYLKRECR